MATKSELLDYLKHISDWALKYHNHKELSSWAVVALYVAFAVEVAERDNWRPELPAYKIFASFVLTVITAVVFVLLRWQLQLRSWAADLGAAAKRLYAEILELDHTDPRIAKFDLTIHPDDRRSSTHQFPRGVIDAVDQAAQRDRDARFWLSFGAIAIVVISFTWVLMLWWREV